MQEREIIFKNINKNENPPTQTTHTHTQTNTHPDQFNVMYI